MLFADHMEIIKIAISYTLLGAFIFTTVVTLLAIIRLIRIDRNQLRILFKVLIVQLIVGCVGFFLGMLNLNAATAQKEIEEPIIREKKGLDYSLLFQQNRVDDLEEQLKQLAAKLDDQVVAQKVNELEVNALEKEAKANIKWAVLKDAHRNSKYHSYKQRMNKFEAILKAQSHNRHAQDIIRKFGAEKTLAYLGELGE